MRELATIATTRVTAAEACGFRAYYDPAAKGRLGGTVFVALDDPGQKILKEIRAQQGPGAVILLREKRA